MTQELYEAVMGKNPSRWKGPRNSVEMVSWDEANDFCRKVTAELRAAQAARRRTRSSACRREAEWEYACRAGTTTRYSFGDDAGTSATTPGSRGNSKGDDPPVGRKKPNAWGLYDMHGYVWEWCAGRLAPDHKGAADSCRASRRTRSSA